jgi:transcriptional regulator with XRE-family HTH domain
VKRDATAGSVGSIIKKARLENNVGLRDLANKIGVTPGYLSQVEHGTGSPPTEKTISAIAEALGQHPEKLLAAAGHLAPDFVTLLRKHPNEMTTLLSAIRKYSADEIAGLIKSAERRKKPRP